MGAAPPKRIPISALLTTSFISALSNSLTSLAVPWFVLALTGSVSKTGLTAATSMLLDDLKVGVRYIRREAWLWQLVLVAIIVNFLAAPYVAVLTPYLAKEVWNDLVRFGVRETRFGAGVGIGADGGRGDHRDAEPGAAGAG